MKRSTKAALFSGLVYPGAGHWYLKKKGAALLFALVATAALYVLMSGAWLQANLIAEQILRGEVQPEIGSLLNQFTVPGDQSSSSASLATAGMGVVWLAGILDAWRLGRKEA